MTNVLSLTKLTLARHQLHELVLSTEDDFNMFSECDNNDRINEKQITYAYSFHAIVLIFTIFPNSAVSTISSKVYTWQDDTAHSSANVEVRKGILQPADDLQ